jgi:hypothetical protein
MENDEKKYEEVIKTLKGLQEVKAPANFEADLQRRINSEKLSKEEKKSFWQNIFVPAKLIPSLGLVSAAIVLFFVVDTNSEEMDNPFLIEPRVREDVFEVVDYDELQKKQEEIPKQKSLKKDEPLIENRRDENKLRVSDEKEVSGREKSAESEGLLIDEIDLAKDQEITSGAFSAIEESTITLTTQNPQPTVPTEASSEMVTGQVITKEELNFRQVQLNEEEQKVVNELRNQVQSLEKTNKSQK